MTASTGVPFSEDGIASLQRRTLRVLVASQILGGVGVGAGVAVISLLAYDLSGTESLSGVPSTATTLGAALAALAIARVAVRSGRRPGLVIGYLIGATGAALAVLAAVIGSFPVHVVAGFGVGWANASNLQARYAATDLAAENQRASSLSTVMWATTVGAVLGPNLSGPGSRVALVLGLPDLAGPYVFAFVLFLGAAVLQAVFLRPDPLLAGRQWAREQASRASRAPAGQSEPSGQQTIRGSLRIIRSYAGAHAALIAISSAHAVMMGVMFMTPVHMEQHGASIQLVGLTISLHIAGMYAFSPVVGKLADRIGRRMVLLGGCGQLALAAILSATSSPMGSAAFQLGLILLGTGWSFCLVAGSTLLTEALPLEHRPGAQGTSDLIMNLAGGAGGTLGGIVLAVASYEVLALGALVVLVAPMWKVLRLESDAPDMDGGRGRTKANKSG